VRALRYNDWVLTRELLMPEKQTVAILGASKDRSKYGNKAVRAYVQRGWTVYPVNPNETEVEGVKC